MKRIFLMLALAVLPLAAGAQDGAVDIKVKSIERRGDMLHVELDMEINGRGVHPTEEWHLTPQVRSASGRDSLVLPGVVVCGNNRANMYARMRRFGRAVPGEIIRVRRGTCITYHYEAQARYPDWADGARVVVRESVVGCAGRSPRVSLVMPDGPVTSPQVATPETVRATELMAPAMETVKQRALSATADIEFAANRYAVLSGYRDNARELSTIRETIDRVRTDPGVTITGITLTGGASPDGSYELNERLARNRTRALSEYIAETFGIGSIPITARWVAEDWDGLRNMVEQSDMHYKGEVLAVIDSPDPPDDRETRLKELYGGAPYREMLTGMFPSLRRTGYRIDFIIKDFGTMAERLDAFERDPSLLGCYELYTLARSYLPGSAMRERIFTAAVEHYPDDPAANNNMAVLLIDRGDHRAAQPYLDKAGDSPEAQNNRAVAAAALARE